MNSIYFNNSSATKHLYGIFLLVFRKAALLSSAGLQSPGVLLSFTFPKKASHFIAQSIPVIDEKRR
jgi:hypothetical protein